MILAVLNLTSAIINGILTYAHYRKGNYSYAILQAFISGFCLAVGILLFVIELTK